MERQQDRGMRFLIVQQFIQQIDNDQERIVCYCYMQQLDDYEIRKQLHIRQSVLDRIKQKLADGLLRAGIRLRGE